MTCSVTSDLWTLNSSYKKQLVHGCHKLYYWETVTTHHAHTQFWMNVYDIMIPGFVRQGQISRLYWHSHEIRPCFAKPDERFCPQLVRWLANRTGKLVASVVHQLFSRYFKWNSGFIIQNIALLILLKDKYWSLETPLG